VGSLWHHKQVYSHWSDSISNPTKAPPPPHTTYFGACNRQDLLIWRWLISSSFHPHLFKVQSSPVPYNYRSRTCILGDKKCFYWWVQKQLKSFALQSAWKRHIILNVEISLPELHLPSLSAYSLVWMQNIAHFKPGGCNSSLLFS
jgi:hypothetical protein